MTTLDNLIHRLRVLEESLGPGELGELRGLLDRYEEARKPREWRIAEGCGGHVLTDGVSSLTCQRYGGLDNSLGERARQLLCDALNGKLVPADETMTTIQAQRDALLDAFELYVFGEVQDGRFAERISGLQSTLIDWRGQHRAVAALNEAKKSP